MSDSPLPQFPSPLHLDPSVVRTPGQRARRFAGWSALVFFVVVLALGFGIKVDEVALVPGTVRDTEPLVIIEGTESFPSDGEILYTTIRLRQELSLFESLFLQLDDDAELLPAEVVLGDRTPEANREMNLELMVDSKRKAVAVALEALGYETITSDGVVVAEVIEGSAADGFLEIGDTITAVDDRPMPSALDLIDFLAGNAPGVELTFDVEHADASSERVTVVMGARDDEENVAFLGIYPLDRVAIVEVFPFEVEIDSGSVGGPSAGLAFTLGVIDAATEGDLTGGERVAVTGTIEFDGQVGAVGGVPQKAAAVRAAIAEIQADTERPALRRMQ